MAKGSFSNNVEDSLFKKMDREMERELNKEADGIQNMYKHTVIIKNGNIYAVMGEVYKLLQKRDRTLFNEVKTYLAKNQKKMSYEKTIEYLQQYIEFTGETAYGERFELHRADDIKNIK